MTQAMPSTKPNIMITARLLLMPVLSSVELKPVREGGEGVECENRGDHQE